MIRLSTSAHTELWHRTLHSAQPLPGWLWQRFLSKGFSSWPQHGTKSGEALSRLLQGPSPAVHTNHTGQSSGEVKNIPHQVGQATGERSREVNRKQRSVEIRKIPIRGEIKYVSFEDFIDGWKMAAQKFSSLRQASKIWIGCGHVITSGHISIDNNCCFFAH